MAVGNDKVIHVDDATFETEVINSDIPVLVDFWATWCGPCRMIAPIVSELSLSHDGRLKVAKVDVDTARTTAAKFNIRSIPTLLIFNKGKVASQLVGAVPKTKIVAALDKVL